MLKCWSVFYTQLIKSNHRWPRIPPPFVDAASFLFFLSWKMQQIGFTYKFLADNRKFKKVALRYHNVLVSILFALLRFVFRRGNNEIFDVYTFASFRWMMGILAGMMASTYSMALGVHAYYKAIGSSDRVYEEMAMFFGFLTLLFFSINLFGFWGIIWLPGFPLIVLVSAIIPFWRADLGL